MIAEFPDGFQRWNASQLEHLRHNKPVVKLVSQVPNIQSYFPANLSPGAHLVSTTNRRAIPPLPLSIGWREGWGERPRATLLPAGLPPLPIGWGEGRGEGSCVSPTGRTNKMRPC